MSHQSNAAAIVDGLLRGPAGFNAECRGVGYDPESPAYVRPGTQPAQLAAEARVRQWRWLMVAAEQILALAAQLVDPRCVHEGEGIRRLRALLQEPAAVEPNRPIVPERMLEAARACLDLAIELEAEIVAIRTRGAVPRVPVGPPGRGRISREHRGAEEQVYESLAVDGPQTAAELTQRLSGLSRSQVSQLCSHSSRIEVRRVRCRGSATLWGVARNGKPRRKPR